MNHMYIRAGLENFLRVVEISVAILKDSTHGNVQFRNFECFETYEIDPIILRILHCQRHQNTHYTQKRVGVCLSISWMSFSITGIGYFCFQRLFHYDETCLLFSLSSYPTHALLAVQMYNYVFFIRSSKTDQYFRALRGRKPRITLKSFGLTPPQALPLSYQ